MDKDEIELIVETCVTLTTLMHFYFQELSNDESWHLMRVMSSPVMPLSCEMPGIILGCIWVHGAMFSDVIAIDINMTPSWKSL